LPDSLQIPCWSFRLLTRVKLFLTFLALSLVPLILLAFFNYQNNVRLAAVAAEQQKQTVATNQDAFGRLLNDNNAPAPSGVLLAQAQRNGWISLLVAVLLATIFAFLLTRLWERRSRRLERMTEGVEAIAKGDLDHRIQLSSDELRPLAENLEIMTKQIREQLAREAETQQFQSFVRLSAVLTHDLKNAIESLSLTVSNMERHFDNKEFREDAMKSLTGATNNLKALVTKLSNPAVTLSGEHKRPQPINLVPILRRVTHTIAEPVSYQHKITVDMPPSVPALVDSERIEKVIENLVINALEAMDKVPGTLTVAANVTKSGQPFFSVSDTGVGMSRKFIDERLFRPFATTKRRGVGLGLYTCREVVVANGGTIEVESYEGMGTTFRVLLPAPDKVPGNSTQAK
jgi:signal transduction histidine kinase